MPASLWNIDNHTRPRLLLSTAGLEGNRRVRSHRLLYGLHGIGIIYLRKCCWCARGAEKRERTAQVAVFNHGAAVKGAGTTADGMDLHTSSPKPRCCRCPPLLNFGCSAYPSTIDATPPTYFAPQELPRQRELPFPGPVRSRQGPEPPEEACTAPRTHPPRIGS